MIENGKVVFNEDIDNIKGTTLEELFIKEGGGINQQSEILIIPLNSRQSAHYIVTDTDIRSMHQMNTAMEGK